MQGGLFNFVRLSHVAVQVRNVLKMLTKLCNLEKVLSIQNRPVPAPHRRFIKQMLGRAVSPQQGGLVTPEVGVASIVARVPADL